MFIKNMLYALKAGEMCHDRAASALDTSKTPAKVGRLAVCSQICLVVLSSVHSSFHPLVLGVKKGLQWEN